MLLGLSVELIHVGLCFGPSQGCMGLARGAGLAGACCCPPCSRGQLRGEMQDEGSAWRKQSSKPLTYRNRINNSLNLQRGKVPRTGKCILLLKYFFPIGENCS